MRLWWAVVAGIGLGGGLAWWLARDDATTDSDGRKHARQTAVQASPAPPLYRWRDDAGVLQLTDQPPAGRPYERIERDLELQAEVRDD